jgi:hypothetical protein
MLRRNSFKFRRGIFWVTSRESPNKLWLKLFKESDDEVKAFLRREVDDHPAPWVKDYDEVVEQWLKQWERGVHLPSAQSLVREVVMRLCELSHRVD